MKIFRAVAKYIRKKQEFHYARITSLGICNEVFRVEQPLDMADAIPVNGLDTSLIGKRWIGYRWVG